MKASRSFVAVLLTAAVLFQLSPHAKGCGPDYLQAVFVMKDSPDPPFIEFTQGKIGIVQPSFGRKTLTIAYRYLNGGSFTEQEQKALVDALNGKGPESDTDQKLKEWIEARKLVVKEEGELPDVYRQTFGAYDFFPNCTSNAFEVATQTLKDRSARFGADNDDVHEWLSGQDIVFRNCSDAHSLPRALGPERPEWLRKDRDYQIAASFFYSLQLDEAVKRFEQISQDNQSDWQSLSDYLVGRALVRKGSLERDESLKRMVNQKAEAYLVALSSRAGKYRDATRKLLGLVRYRLRPEERVRELAQTLTQQSGSIDLRQDLIDYVWLMDKFDAQLKKQEEERQKLLNPPKDSSEFTTTSSPDTQESSDQLQQRPDEIDITIHTVNAAGQIDYALGQTFSFKPDTTIAEILKTIEKGLGRKLTDEETKSVNQQQSMALYFRRLERSPNRKLNAYDYEGCYYGCEKVPLSMYPAFVTADELSDWLVTFQSKDDQAYSHSLKKWRETQSPAWFVSALVKSNKSSASVLRLLSHAAQIQPDTPMYATVAYNRIRILIELGRGNEARQLLNQIIERRLDTFPVSAQNEFLEQRMNVAEGLSPFLRFALRKPLAFYQDGRLGSIKEVLDYKELSTGEGGDEQELQRVKRMIEWDGRTLFDERAADILNWHFSVSALMQVARDPALPEYLRERVFLAAWTRAILLKNDRIASQAADEIARTIADKAELFRSYLRARTPAERDAAATFALLKLPELSPYFSEGVPEMYTGLIPDPHGDYYLGMGWWCVLPQTDYDEESQGEKPKKVVSPTFLTPELLNAAQTERAALIELGDAKTLLGKRAIEWAKLSPNDTRVPEALFIAVMANESYKYGCNAWEHDEEIRNEAAWLLNEMYPNSVWALKLREVEQK
jgi:hypothetical protein